MSEKGKPFTILYADDDEDDQMLVGEALKETPISNAIQYVQDGEELLEFLRNSGKYTDKEKYPKPNLILLDLNMPRKDGREALAEIKADPQLKRIPIIILTTSRGEDDIQSTYNLGVNSFITKPVSYDSLVKIVKIITKYWFHTVKLPVNGEKAHEKRIYESPTR
jgi:CheY-like chemotaxis protein